MQIGYHNLNVGCLYRPPDERVQFWTTLEEVLEPLEGSDIVLLGDLNVDTLDKTHPQFSYLNRLNYSLQTKDIVCSPTRCTATSSKCLDVILTNVHYFKKGAVMEDLDISDHALVLLWPLSWPRWKILQICTGQSELAADECSCV